MPLLQVCINAWLFTPDMELARSGKFSGRGYYLNDFAFTPSRVSNQQVRKWKLAHFPDLSLPESTLEV